MLKNIWKDGMLGLITGDALGSPVQFLSREEIRDWGYVEGMEAGGKYKTPMGTWTDDSSLSLATLCSIIDNQCLVPEDIMERFCDWFFDGDYTPFGKSFDRGATCSKAIRAFEQMHDISTCGATGADENGNGALMRILPVCIYCSFLDRAGAVGMDETVYELTGLTHNHLRSKMASALYYHLVKHIIYDNGDLQWRMQRGLLEWMDLPKTAEESKEMVHFERVENIILGEMFMEDDINSTGYVIDSLEAACWSLVMTRSFEDCLLTAVNLGGDADTIGAITGGLAGLYYGSEDIPQSWLDVIQKIGWIRGICDDALHIPIAGCDLSDPGAKVI